MAYTIDPPAPIQRLQHPVFGSLMNNEDDNGWVGFRKFPFLEKYTWAATDTDGKGGRSTREFEAPPEVARWAEPDSKLVRHPSALALVCLHRLGIGSFDISMGAESPEPRAEQVATFQAFVGQEAAWCQAITDAVWRHYQWLVKEELWGFVMDDGKETAFTDPEQLPQELEIGAIFIPRCSSGGEAPMAFSFDAAWEPEHGYYVILHRGTAIFIGSWDDMRDFTEEPMDERQEWMTDAEHEALQAFVEDFDAGDPTEEE